MNKERLDKLFLTSPNEEDQQLVLAYNTFVRTCAHTALEQIYKDALEFAGEGSAASLLVSRTINLIYQSHHEIMLYYPELNEQEG